MTDAGTTLVVAGLALTAGGIAMLAFGAYGLVFAGAAALFVGLAASTASYLRDDGSRVACPECGAENRPERVTCRECETRFE